MSENNIHPDKITTPIQLLAVWLIGLIVLVGSLLTAAAKIKQPDWLSVFFSISAVLIILIFLYINFSIAN